jgi:eukaryotic-like serine/threonine-protein kinase
VDDRYRLQERLGAGGMSEVWRAHDEVLGRDVAVKVLAPGADADPSRSARIRLEARAAAGLRHQNIVDVYDYGEAVDSAGQVRPYVVMELVEGTSLDDLLRERELPWPAAVRIGAQVAAALAHAHARGVVHRDVKPGNVMVTRDGVKLVDFGISAAAGAVDETNGEVLGTPAYLAPERLDGGPVRVATDVYALGLLLYRALAGRLPWTGSTVTEMVGNHLYTDPAPLPRIAGLPSRVADLCRRALAKRPEDRPTAAEAARILGAAVGLPDLEPLALPNAVARAGAATVAVKPPRARRPRRTATAGLPTMAVKPPLAVRVHRRPAVLVAVAVAVFSMMSSFVWWPSGAPQSVRAEAATVPTAAPPTSSATPTPKTTTTSAVHPVTRKTKPAAKADAKPRPKAVPKAEPKPKAVAKPPKKPAKVKVKKVKVKKAK